MVNAVCFWKAAQNYLRNPPSKPAFIFYAGSFSAGFVLDDDPHIVRNIRIRSPGNAGEILATRRPWVELSLAANYAFGKLNPVGYHLFNVIRHILAGLTLYGVIRRTLQLPRLNEKFGASAHWFALSISLLWIVHPLQTESVTDVIQRAESMMGLFYLLTLYCFIRGSLQQRPPGAVGSLHGRAANPMECYQTQPSVILNYFKLSSWPDDLCMDYKLSPLKDTRRIVLTTAILLVLVAAACALLRLRPAIGFLAASVFIVLAPTTYHWRLELAFEHRIYLSLAGLTAMVVFISHHAFTRFREKAALPQKAITE